MESDLSCRLRRHRRPETRVTDFFLLIYLFACVLVMCFATFIFICLFCYMYSQDGIGCLGLLKGLKFNVTGVNLL